MPIISRSAGSNFYMKDAPFEFRKDKCVVNFGAKYGRSAQQQHEMHQRTIQQMQDMKKRSKAGKKADIEWLGTMPGEMVDSISRHEGDQEAVAKDPVGYLKKTGLYQGD